MIPVYCSDRAKIGGWYAYKSTGERPLIWDGGVGRDDNFTGLWDAMTALRVDAKDSFLNTLPNVPMWGSIVGDEFIVTALPHPSQLFTDMEKVKAIGEETGRTIVYAGTDENQPVPFLSEVVIAMELLEGSPCRFVPVTILPDDNDEALRRFRDMGDLAIARHPGSVWKNKRSPAMLSNHMPKDKYTVRIREFLYDDDGEISHFTCWQNTQKVTEVPIMYIGDQDPINSTLLTSKFVTLFLIDNVVVGYQ